MNWLGNDDPDYDASHNPELHYGMIGVRLIWLAAIHAVEVVDSSSPTVSPPMIQPQNHAGNAGP